MLRIDGTNYWSSVTHFGNAQTKKGEVMPIMPQPISPPTTSDFATGNFPDMYYDTAVDQAVIGLTFRSDDSLTASITAGVPYFKISRIDVCDWLALPALG